MAREFPIANGKLVTDLDANGFKILNIQGGGGGSGGTTDYNDLNNIPKMNGVEVSGSKSAEDYGLATKEELYAVGRIAQGASDGASTAIGKVDNLTNDVIAKRDKADNIAAKDEAQFAEWKFHCDEPAIQAALDATPPIIQPPTDPGADDYSPWTLVGIPTVEGYRFARDASDETYDANAVSLTFTMAYISNTSEDRYDVTATREKITVTKSGEPYVTPTGVKNIALPKYEFVDATIADGLLTVAPYTNAQVTSDGTAFEVAVAEGDGKTRDCVLRVECGETAPTITWPENFHPRTDAGADFACVAGVKNVYWITEYAPNEFCVAGWQATTGGNAQ